MNPILLPKEDPELPDSYGMEIHFIGEKDSLCLDLAAHTIVDKVYSFPRDLSGPVYAGIAAAPYLEYTTKDDITGIIPLSSIKHIVFDKQFSKMRAIREKMIMEKNKGEPNA